MSKLAVLTKPRFSLLHLAALVVVALFCITLAAHWDAFMAGYHDGYNAASSMLHY
jgi:hypothetical protein